MTEPDFPMKAPIRDAWQRRRKTTWPLLRLKVVNDDSSVLLPIVIDDSFQFFFVINDYGGAE